MSSLVDESVPLHQEQSFVHQSSELDGSSTPTHHQPDDVAMRSPVYEAQASPKSEGDEPVRQNEPDPSADIDEEMTDLFGNDEDVEEANNALTSSNAPSRQESERLPSQERERRQALEYDEEGDPGEVVVREANVAFPNIPVPQSSDGNNWILRMPNYIKVDSKPFHPDTYLGPEEEEAQQGENVREKSMSIKLKVENTLRWRWIKGADGVDRKQSNSRIIRWSDGSLSLRLGKELFDVSQSIDNSGAAPRQILGDTPSKPQSQSQSQSQDMDPATGGKPQGLTYLVAQHKGAGVLQSEAVVTGYMSLRPTGMQSETHRMLVRAVGQKHNKVARLRLVDQPTIDPEREVQELMKQANRKSKRRDVDAEVEADDELGGGGGIFSSRGKKSRKQRRRDADVYSEDDDEEPEYGGSEDEYDNGMASKSSDRRKAKRRSSNDHGEEEEDMRGGVYQQDGFVVADFDEDDGSDDGRKKRRRDDMMEEDVLDKLDLQIEEQQKHANKRSNPRDEDAEGEPEDGEPEEQMDVESEEEDEEEFQVRRAGGAGSRRRRAVGADDEDDE